MRRAGFAKSPQAWLKVSLGNIVETGLVTNQSSLFRRTVSVSVIVASLPVIVSFIYRLRNKDPNSNGPRYATDYDNTRRAKPGGVWAGPHGLVSSSGEQRGTKTHLTSLAIQLSEVRHTDTLDIGGADDHKRQLGDDASFDARRKKGVDESSEDIGMHSVDSSHVAKDRNRTVDFTVSAISYGGRRRDPEYDIDIVDDLEADRAAANAYVAYGYPPATEYNNNGHAKPFTSPPTPTPTPGTVDSDAPYNAGRNSYLFVDSNSPLSASNPYSPASIASPPPAAATRGRPEHSRHPSNGTGNILSTALRRTGSSATRLGRGGRSDEAGDSDRSRTKSSSRSRSHSRPRGANDVEAAAPSGNRSFLPGFLRGHQGVLIEQSVVVSSDPEHPRGL